LQQRRQLNRLTKNPALKASNFLMMLLNEMNCMNLKKNKLRPRGFFFQIVFMSRLQ
jgi:hypothetical protein